MRYLIVNADDFGASHGINRGVVVAHRDGIVTSTSLMVNMPATEAAVALAREMPGLSVGLHVNFTNEGDDPVVDLEDLSACQRELHTQFDRFVEFMGRRPTHLDSQHNVHFRTDLVGMFSDLAERESLPLRGRSRAPYFGGYYGQWDGETHLEYLAVDSLKKLIVSHARGLVTEFACHPGYVDADFHTVYDIEREAEVEALCDPSLRPFLVESGFTLVGFGELSKVEVA